MLCRFPYHMTRNKHQVIERTVDGFVQIHPLDSFCVQNKKIPKGEIVLELHQCDEIALVYPRNRTGLRLVHSTKHKLYKQSKIKIISTQSSYSLMLLSLSLKLTVYYDYCALSNQKQWELANDEVFQKSSPTAMPVLEVAYKVQLQLCVLFEHLQKISSCSARNKTACQSYLKGIKSDIVSIYFLLLDPQN